MKNRKEPSVQVFPRFFSLDPEFADDDPSNSRSSIIPHRVESRFVPRYPASTWPRR